MSTGIPLCVDLDGTLLNSDLLLEAAFAQIKQAPLSVLYWPRWLAGQGPAQGGTGQAGGTGH